MCRRIHHTFLLPRHSTDVETGIITFKTGSKPTSAPENPYSQSSNIQMPSSLLSLWASMWLVNPPGEEGTYCTRLSRYISGLGEEGDLSMLEVFGTVSNGVAGLCIKGVTTVRDFNLEQWVWD